MFNVLTRLESKYREIRGQSDYLPIVGDAKTYNHLVDLKRSYGRELSWLIPLPGDWHILKNFQPVLFKAYYDAGLKALAGAAGYPHAAIQSNSQFSFILEAWEAIYRVMLKHYMESRDTETTTKPSLLEDIASSLQSLPVADLSQNITCFT